MDRYNTIEYVRLSHSTFNAQNYVLYRKGAVVSKGKVGISIDIMQQKKLFSNSEYLVVNLAGNSITDIISSSFTFDKCITSDDRLLMYTLPAQTNVDILVLNTLRIMGFPPTRSSKSFSSIEPVCGSIFKEKGKIIRISFTISDDSLIEFE